ncbi:site-specific DNA-methyltransferase [Candidatus Woesearchaeota archaeon]|nr:site-specific DNA-methyltransferase [Candidatus Woesearchaeota archaeon]
MVKKNGTKTQSFGVSSRENHDSSEFYNRKMYGGNGHLVKHDYTENKLTEDKINKIICSSSENMKELPDNSVHLMVTSPPYNVGKDYDANLSLQEYKNLLKNVFKETHRVLVCGGRVCVNIANIGRKPYIPLHSHIIQMMDEIGFLMRGEIIWDKGSSAGTSFAWGSWKSAKNPTLRDVHEYILVFSKESYGREKNDKRDTIEKDEFMQFTKSVWSFPAVSARKIGHPAPFPEELPRRLIKFYTFENDIVLDPFMGSGQTAIASVKEKRNFIGYEINKEYCELSERRIRELKEQTKLNEIQLEAQ